LANDLIEIEFVNQPGTRRAFSFVFYTSHVRAIERRRSKELQRFCVLSAR